MNWLKYGTRERIRQVLDDFFHGGASSAFTEVLAKRLDAVIYLDDTFDARMHDGTKVDLRMVNKGDIVPGFDKDGMRYEAYTLYYCIKFGGLERPPIEEYIQIDRVTVELAGNLDGLLATAMEHALDRAGVDLSTVEKHGEKVFV